MQFTARPRLAEVSIMGAWPVGVPLAEETGKPSALDGGNRSYASSWRACSPPHLCPLPPWLFLHLTLSPTSSPEPPASFWHSASAHLPGSFLPLFFQHA